MRGPTVLRRIGARFDRRIAAGVFAVVAVVLLGAVLVTCADDPKPEADTSDPAAARELVALMRAGEHGSWLAQYEFARTLANGRALRQPLTEARHGNQHVVISGSAMSVERAGRSFDCNLVDEHATCHATTRARAVPASGVLRVAVGAGAYEVSRQAPTTIAGVRARCFRVTGTGRGMLPAIGSETDMCLSAAGVPLSQRVVRPSGDVDERNARSVRENVGGRAVEALERSFDSGPASESP